jgi:nitrite reductase (NADH) small subunit
MSELIRIGALADLPQSNHAKEISAAGRAFCIANVDGEICAMDNVCPHRGGPLGEGTIENGKLICPWHAWEFDPRSGKCHTSDQHVKTYPVVTEGEDAFVEI